MWSFCVAPHNILSHVVLGGSLGWDTYSTAQLEDAFSRTQEMSLWTLYVLCTRFLVGSLLWVFWIEGWASLPPPLLELLFLSWTYLILESWPLDLFLHLFLQVTHQNCHDSSCHLSLLPSLLPPPLLYRVVLSILSLLATEEHRT